MANQRSQDVQEKKITLENNSCATRDRADAPLVLQRNNSKMFVMEKVRFNDTGWYLCHVVINADRVGLHACTVVAKEPNSGRPQPDN